MSSTRTAEKSSAGARAPAASGSSVSQLAGGPAQRLGNGQLQALLQARVFQAKLTVSHPRDAFEQEADHVADRVMRMADPASPAAERAVARSPRVERRTSDDRGDMLRSSSPASPDVPTVDAATERSIQSLSGRGGPLPRSVRSFMEPRFDADFSTVRVHDDAHAHALARSVDAQAFTVGRDVVFGAGHYAPESERGRRLLAHELTHVVQQSAAGRPAAADPAAARRSSDTAPASIDRRVDRVMRAPATQADAVTQPDLDSQPDAAEARIGFVGEEGLNLREAPDQHSASLATMRLGLRLHLLADSKPTPGWLRVNALGQSGYVYAPHVLFPPEKLKKDPAVRLIKVPAKLSFWGLVRDMYGIRGDESTKDQNMNHFINAIRAVNKPEAFDVRMDKLDKVGNFFLTGRDAKNTFLRANVRLWIPGFDAASGMRVGSGTFRGQISGFIRRLEQKWDDFLAAGAKSLDYMADAITSRAGAVAHGLISGLIDFGKTAVKILLAGTAAGALLGLLFGAGAGAVPGAEIGFEIALQILNFYGLVTLVETILSFAVGLVAQLGRFVKFVWGADGDKKEVDLGARALADAMGILVSAILAAVVILIQRKGIKALARTKFARTVGQSRLMEWYSNRKQLGTLNENAGTIANAVRESPLAKSARNGRQQRELLELGPPPRGMAWREVGRGDWKLVPAPGFAWRNVGGGYDVLVQETAAEGGALQVAPRATPSRVPGRTPPLRTAGSAAATRAPRPAAVSTAPRAQRNGGSSTSAHAHVPTVDSLHIRVKGFRADPEKGERFRWSMPEQVRVTGFGRDGRSTAPSPEPHANAVPVAVQETGPAADTLKTAKPAEAIPEAVNRAEETTRPIPQDLHVGGFANNAQRANTAPRDFTVGGFGRERQSIPAPLDTIGDAHAASPAPPTKVIVVGGFGRARSEASYPPPTSQLEVGGFAGEGKPAVPRSGLLDVNSPVPTAAPDEITLRIATPHTTAAPASGTSQSAPAHLPDEGTAGAETVDVVPATPDAGTGIAGREPLDAVPVAVVGDSDSTNRLSQNRERAGERIGDYFVTAEHEIREGEVYNLGRVKVWRISGMYHADGRQFQIGSILRFMDALIADARAHGCDWLRLEGNLVVTPTVLRINALAQRYGGRAHAIDDHNVVMIIPLGGSRGGGSAATGGGTPGASLPSAPEGASVAAPVVSTAGGAAPATHAAPARPPARPPAHPPESTPVSTPLGTPLGTPVSLPRGRAVPPPVPSRARNPAEPHPAGATTPQRPGADSDGIVDLPHLPAVYYALPDGTRLITVKDGLVYYQSNGTSATPMNGEVVRKQPGAFYRMVGSQQSDPPKAPRRDRKVIEKKPEMKAQLAKIGRGWLIKGDGIAPREANPELQNFVFDDETNGVPFTTPEQLNAWLVSKGVEPMVDLFRHVLWWRSFSPLRWLRELLTGTAEIEP